MERFEFLRLRTTAAQLRSDRRDATTVERLEVENLDRRSSQSISVGGRKRDSFDDVDALGNLTKRRKLAVKLRLR